MPVTPVNKYLSFIGLGKEVTPNTAVVATSFPPVTSMQPEDVKNYVPDTGMRGSFIDSYNQVPTQGWSTFTYGGNVHMDTIGVPLKAILGAEDLSGTGPYVHVLALLNSAQPPTYTISHYNGFNTRQFPGSVCSDLEFTFDASGLLGYTASWLGLPSATGTKPTQVFSSKPATAGYVGVLTVAGTALARIEQCNIKLARAVNPILAVNGTTSPAAMWAGAVKATGQFTVIYQDDSLLAAMLAGTSQTFEASFTNGADILDIKCTSMLETKGVIGYGKDWVEHTFDFEGVGNTTDANTSGGGYSPLKATLTNSVTAAY